MRTSSISRWIWPHNLKKNNNQPNKATCSTHKSTALLWKTPPYLSATTINLCSWSMTSSSSSSRKLKPFYNPFNVMNFWWGKWTFSTGISTSIRSRFSRWMRRRPHWRFLWWAGPYKIRRLGYSSRLRSLMRNWLLWRIYWIMCWMCSSTLLITSIMTGLRLTESFWRRVRVRSWFW